MRAPEAFLLGDSAVILAWEQKIDPELHRHIVGFAGSLKASPFAGFIEAAPAYASLAVHFDLRLAPDNIVDVLLDHWHARPPIVANMTTRTIRIPVRYDGPDLAELSIATGLSPAEIAKIHSGRTYRVYMLGFLPGFAYMGEIDERIRADRKATPRTKVPAGSVGIAGRQTGVYPLESPGGWQLIGTTSLVLFDPNAEEPALLRAGDEVVFEAID